MTDDAKLDQISLSLRIYNLGDIQKARQADCNIGAFILCSCFIDHLSRYRYYNSIKNDKNRFIAFADNYLPSFKGNGKKLYQSLRSSLVHNYSTRGHYALAWGDRSVHLTIYAGKAVNVDLDEFILELESALTRLLNELHTDQAIRKQALAHYDTYPIMTQVQ